MSSSTSSRTTVLLFHDDCHLDFCSATGVTLVRSGCDLLSDAGFAPLFLSREKRGILRGYNDGADMLKRAA